MRPYATIAAIVLMLALIAQSGCTEQRGAPKVPNFPPISGTVVDAETGEPIEGAAVIATWVAAAGIGGGSYMGMNEELTNSAGVFNINGVAHGGTDFYFVIYKYGYLAYSKDAKMINSSGTMEYVPGFEWTSGQTYKLEKFPPDWSHDAHYNFIQSSLGEVYSPLWYKAAAKELDEASAERRKIREEQKKMRMKDVKSK